MSSIHPSSPSLSLLSLASSCSLEIEHSIKHNVDNLFRLTSLPLQTLYQQFVLQQQTLSSLLAMNIAFSIYTLPFFAFLAFNIRYCNTAYEYFNWYSAIVLIPLFNVLIWGVYFRYKSIIAQTNGNLPEKAILAIQMFQKGIYFIFQIIAAYRMVSKVVAGPCKDVGSVPENWNCNQYGVIGAIPSEMVLVLFFDPVFYMLSVRGAHLHFALMLWMMSIITSVFCMIYANSTASVIFVVYCMLGSLFMLAESKKFNYFMFFSQLKLQEIMLENERIASESKATEMKHIIGNVAHDLKTVRAAPK
jgi:hypothetical protein